MAAIRDILVAAPDGQQIPLGQLARLETAKGPPAIKTENARPNAWVWVDIERRDVGTYVRLAQEAVASGLTVPAGYSLEWSRQHEYMLAVPFSLIGAFWLIYPLGSNTSIAAWVGVIALSGVSAETGVVMLLYLDGAYDEAVAAGRLRTREDLVAAVYQGPSAACARRT